MYQMATEAQAEQISEPTVQQKGVVGLRNLGNTCYANSAIQALRMMTEMTYLCVADNSELKKTQDTPSGQLFEAYRDLIKTMWSTHNPAYISPDAFWRDMLAAADSAGYEHFRGRDPQDAHEFLMFLLDQIFEATKQEVNFMIQRPPPVSDVDHRIHKALTSWKQQFEKQYTPIVDVWFGLFEFETECQGCKHKFYRYESFNTLKVAVPHILEQGKELPTIQEMLRADWKPETIEGYACDNCSPERTTAVRTYKIWRMPRCLVLMLKRFLPDGRKITSPWRLPENEPLVFDEFFSEASPERSKHYKYSLQSCIDHHGSARGGHYTAQGLNPISGKWGLYDDENSTLIEKPFLGSSSYVLLFRAQQQE
jgi:ubiquitin C-terminal hydrolase